METNSKEFNNLIMEQVNAVMNAQKSAYAEGYKAGYIARGLEKMPYVEKDLIKMGLGDFLWNGKP